MQSCWISVRYGQTEVNDNKRRGRVGEEMESEVVRLISVGRRNVCTAWE